MMVSVERGMWIIEHALNDTPKTTCYNSIWFIGLLINNATKPNWPPWRLLVASDKYFYIKISLYLACNIMFVLNSKYHSSAGLLNTHVDCCIRTIVSDNVFYNNFCEIDYNAIYFHLVARITVEKQPTCPKSMEHTSIRVNLHKTRGGLGKTNVRWKSTGNETVQNQKNTGYEGEHDGGTLGRT
jgi:hypothetical protein